MVKAVNLTGNPLSVFDGNHDTSNPFDDTEARAELRTCGREIGEDVSKIIAAFAQAGLTIERHVALYAWGEHSSAYSAHWLALPLPREIVEKASRFLVVEDGR